MTPLATSAPPAAAAPPGARRRPRRWWIALASLGLVAAAAFGGRAAYRAWRNAAPASIPTFQVEPGTVQVIAYAKGTLQGGDADRLMAPTLGGEIPRISYLLPAGTAVQAGEVVVRFNTGAEQFKLTQAENALAQAQANITAAEDQAKAQAIQDAYSLEHARNQVLRAQIQVRRNPLLPALDAHENDLDLESAQAQLAQWQHDAAQRQASGQNQIEVQRQAAEKAKEQAAAARQHIASMTLRAGRAGYVALEPNRGGQGVIYQGMMLPPLQVGDQVSPGSVVAQIPDLAQLRVQAHLDEAGSAYVAANQPAQVSIEGVPGHIFPAHILHVSGLAEAAGIFAGPGQRQATCILALDGADPALRPGMDAQARIVLSQLDRVLWVPPEAVFLRDGKPVVYRFQSGAFTAQPVQVLRRGPARIAIAGVPAGTVVALSDRSAGAEAPQ